MITREIKLPENYKKYFKTESEITDLIEDYIELEQDKRLKKELSEDKNFLFLNKIMEEKLWAM